ncbi:MAG: T9SS type A sorting domain-containing protein [Bacteroidota bacterium]
MLHGADDADAQSVVRAAAEFQVNTTVVNRQEAPSVDTDADGDFVVVWQSRNQDGSNFGIIGQRYDKSGATAGSEFQINTYTTGDQQDASVAVDVTGDFVVVWESDGQDGSGSGIYGQRYASDGTPLGGEFQINTTTAGNQSAPSVAADLNGDFVVAWQGSDGSNTGIFAQRFSNAGVAQGSEFQVNTTTAAGQRTPAVGISLDGAFVIAWGGSNQDGSSGGIFAQRYASDGTALGSEFQVNTITPNNQRNPAIGVDQDGDFVIVWETFSGASDYDIAVRRYDSAGTPLGDERRVNTRVRDAQIRSAVSVDAEGNFVVVWDGVNPNERGIYGQRFDADGLAVGSEFRINTFLPGDQVTPVVSGNAFGDFAVAWASDGQDTRGFGVYAQRYSTVDPTVFDYDAQTYVDNGAMDFDRLETWVDAGPLNLDAPLNGSRARLYDDFFRTNNEPVVHYNGVDMGHAIPKADELFGEEVPERSLALAFTTTDDITSRQVIFELGGSDAGFNAYLDNGQLYVGAWSLTGNTGDWGPFFFNRPVGEKTTYVLVLNHRRRTGGLPGQFDAYLNGKRIDIANTVNTFAKTGDNGGIATMVSSTRYHDGVSTPSVLSRAKLNVGRMLLSNEWLTPDTRAALESALATRFGVTLSSAVAPEVPVAEARVLPEGVRLDGVYPNPTSGSATVRYGLDEASEVRVTVYDALGRQVAVLAEGTREAGWHTAVFNEATLASGVYVVRVEAAGAVASQRLTVLR